jgi:LPXTG-site transpeptidase (sortase) family protein
MENTETEHRDTYAPYTSKREQRLVFFFVCVGVVSLTYAFFYIVDFLPEKPVPDDVGEYVDTGTISKDQENHLDIADTERDTQPLITADTQPLPISISIDTLGIKGITVLNPESSSVEALDIALLSGVVRHPDSADFVDTGTIFILGHSSYLPNVRNKNFQAFNGISKLKWGDMIRVQSKDTEYVYSVDRVYEAKASDAEISIQHDTPKLVLATCNSFATKDDRFVVEATLVDSYPRDSK